VAESNVKGLETMKGYQTLRAPFAGRVTARYVDPGTLITNAQTNYVSALPIMTISDDSRLRVYCYVQQTDVPYVNVGDVADVVDASNPERRMKAKISRMTGELETRTRTMQIEVNIDNSDSFLATLPGSAYVSSVALRSDDIIILGGGGFKTGPESYATKVLRLNSDGSLDSESSDVTFLNTFLNYGFAEQIYSLAKRY
jgi:multidrug efflux pump subunit AcrA (membrane-fusion protein)